MRYSVCELRIMILDLLCTIGFLSYIATHTLICKLILGQSLFNNLCDMTVVMAGVLCSHHNVVMH